MELDALYLLEKLGYTITKPNFFRCVATNKELSVKGLNFYQTNNPMYAGCIAHTDDGDLNVLPFSKKWIESTYKELCIKTKNNKKLAMYRLSKILQISWLETIWTMAEESRSADFKIYIGKLNSLKQYSDLTIEDSEPYIGEITELEVEYKEIKKSCSKSRLNELRMFWGNFPDNELIWLQEQYEDWASRHMMDTKALEILIAEICQQQLTIKRMRESGNNVSKELKDLQDLMNSSALKPIQESVAMSNEANTLGIWIKRIENEDPITEVEEQYKDVDGLGKLIRIFFLGHFNKMMGIKNELSEEYELEMSKYTVNLEDGDD